METQTFPNWKCKKKQEMAYDNQVKLNAKRLTTQLASFQKSQQESYQQAWSTKIRMKVDFKLFPYRPMFVQELSDDD